MTISSINRRKIGLMLFLSPLFLLFAYVGVRSGPLAPVSVTIAKVESAEITPSLFGVGVVEARFIHKIGPTITGRIKSLAVDVGDTVVAGYLLGEMDPVDLEQRVVAQSANIGRAEASLLQAEASYSYIKDEAERAEILFPNGAVSRSILDSRRRELIVADSALRAAKEDLLRARADYEATKKQLDNTRLLSPIDGMVVLRNAEVGTTVVPGQAVYEVIDPQTIWINARFDQISSAGLDKGLPAAIVLHSRSRESMAGQVLYVEPKADSVTEEILTKIVFAAPPSPRPPLGELAEVTVALPRLPAAPVVSNASIQILDGVKGVWAVREGSLIFVPVTLGAVDMEGHVQITEGLSDGEQIVVYSERPLSARSRIRILNTFEGLPQ